ncbi:Phage integrase [uncultured Mycobacterium sp.]|uniref:Phage integrase n=1 Tax=uncultured Mycobacterium sp. TaxID=171292 RepID=A0A1Y5P4Y8_9MYCO|nr:Phage integrase [uncultured Mycobacterium sp.]
MFGELYKLPPSWGEAIQLWVEWLVAGGASTETIRLRRGIVRSVARQLGTLRPDDVTTEQLIALCARQKWSNDHRRGLRAALIAFYDWSLSNGAATTNPARGLPSVPESKPKPRPAPDRIWRELLDAADPRELLMARLAGEAGLRRGEVAKTHCEDLIEDLMGWSLIVKGKGDKQRTVPITDALAEAIREYLIEYLIDGYLFPGQIDGHISPGHVGVLISRLMPDGWSMHKLRHRYASRGYAGTKDIRAVQEALGHASVATTQRYTAVSSREIRAVSESAA